MFESGKQNTLKRGNSEYGDYDIKPLKLSRLCTGVRKELFKTQGSSQKKNKKTLNETNIDLSPDSNLQYLYNLGPLKNPLCKTSNQGSAQKRNVKKALVFKTDHLQKKNEVKQHINAKPPPLQLNSETLTGFKSPNTPNFVKLEKLCETSAESRESPISSVCNLLENNMLLDSARKNIVKTTKSQKEILSEIKDIAKRNHEVYETLTAKLQNYEENNRKILDLVNSLENCDSDINNTTQKENLSPAKRRSLRLQRRSPVVGSPVLLKAGDLRKSTLTKSLVSKCQRYQIDSPRIQNAINMYNNARNGCSALLTPKIVRNQMMESPRTNSWRKHLSIKVQEQCLMLQDTPVHK